MRRARLVAPILLCMPLVGCYLVHAARGQWQLLARREPIAAVVTDPATPAPLKSQLESVVEIREFSVRELGLPDNGSYRSYADVGRQFVVWNVFAAPEFSVEPRRWCFPVSGCVTYRGYFSERKARDFAVRLARQGYDVHVAGVPAYSTLGHFDDPVLNTMMGWSDVQLAAIIFHELAHQLLYVPSDSPFNEAFAAIVEDEGVRRWLERAGRNTELEAYRKHRQDYLQIARLFEAARRRLRAVYAQESPAAPMRREKQAVFAQLRRDYESLPRSAGRRVPFDAWFESGLNNAHLVSVATYQDCVPALRGLLYQSGNDLAGFYARARDLAGKQAGPQRQQLCASRS